MICQLSAGFIRITPGIISSTVTHCRRGPTLFRYLAAKPSLAIAILTVAARSCSMNVLSPTDECYTS
jgi:hypothetical protein